MCGKRRKADSVCKMEVAIELEDIACMREKREREREQITEK